MKYDPEHNYQVAVGIMTILIVPFYLFLSSNNFKGPTIVLFTILIASTEYSFFLPRQALRIYEEIKFKSLIERINSIIRIAIIIFYSCSEIYSFTTSNDVLLFTSLVAFVLWNTIFENQSVILGTNNIIIGRKLVSYDLLSKIIYEKRKLIVVANGKSYKIYKWAIGNQQSDLEKLKMLLDDKVMK